MTWTVQTITWAITAVSLAVVIAFRWRRMRRSRPLKLERLWIIPALYSAFAAAMFWHAPPAGRQWLWVIAALAAGGGLGWLRGSTMRIDVDPDTHELGQRQSPAALLLIAALVVVRTAVRSEYAADLVQAGSGVIDAFLAFAVGALSAQRLEMYLRARRLLAAARSAVR